MSNEKTAFEVARKHRGVSTASSIGIIRAYYACASGRPYIHQLYLSKKVTIKCNLKTSIAKCKFLNVA